jgi:predicted transcriptional regulator
MAERKAVLNVTVSQSLADEVRRLAKRGNTTISSVVEHALADRLKWEVIQMRALASVDADYREFGYPTAEELAKARAEVAEEERLMDEARAQMDAEGYEFPPPWMREAIEYWDQITGEDSAA